MTADILAQSAQRLCTAWVSKFFARSDFDSKAVQFAGRSHRFARTYAASALWVLMHAALRWWLSEECTFLNGKTCDAKQSVLF